MTVEWKVLLCFLFVTEILNVDHIRLKNPPSGLEDESVFIFIWKERILCWAPWKELVSVLTCSKCWSYIHENIYVICARKRVTFLDAVYKNFAFFSVIWLESIMFTACSFFILHKLLFLIELIPVVFIVFIDCHCNSDYAHYRVFYVFSHRMHFDLFIKHLCILALYQNTYLAF